MKVLGILIGICLCWPAGTPQEGYTKILKQMVDKQGQVNYKLLHNKPQELNAYLADLAAIDLKGMSANARKALWMNAYNAYTLKVVADHYPVKSIRDIVVDGKTAWDLPIAKVGGKAYTLNQIEHEILRKEFSDYRIHAGINCASFSCPVLLNQPFTADNVDKLLEVAFASFVNDPQRNKISAQKVELSEIFKWFAADFERAGGVLAVVKKYSETEILPTANVSYLPYDWSLNGT
jgi:hypothetical protein